MRKISFISLLLSAFLIFTGGYSTHYTADSYASYQNNGHDQPEQLHQHHKYKKYDQYGKSSSKIGNMIYIAIIALLIAIVVLAAYFAYKEGRLSYFMRDFASTALVEMIFLTITRVIF